MTKKEQLLKLCEGLLCRQKNCPSCRTVYLLIDRVLECEAALKEIGYTDFRDDAHDIATGVLATSALDAFLKEGQGEKT